jgi:hypothetical protein
LIFQQDKKKKTETRETGKTSNKKVQVPRVEACLLEHNTQRQEQETRKQNKNKHTQAQETKTDMNTMLSQNSKILSIRRLKLALKP